MTELISLDEAFLNRFVAEKRPDLAYFVEKVIRQKKHTLSKDAEQVLSNLSSLPSFYQLYEVTKHEDMQSSHLKQMVRRLKTASYYTKTYMKWILIKKCVVLRLRASIKH